MPLFRRHDRNTTTTSRGRRSYFPQFRRKDPNRIAGGYREYYYPSPRPDLTSRTKPHFFAGAALSNPNTTIEGRREAKSRLRHMVRIRTEMCGYVILLIFSVGSGYSCPFYDESQTCAGYPQLEESSCSLRLIGGSSGGSIYHLPKFYILKYLHSVPVYLNVKELTFQLRKEMYSLSGIKESQCSIRY